MHNKFFIILIATLALFSCTNKTDSNSATGIVQKKEEINVIKKVRYTCPMHPQIIRDEPGKCPICGMDLIILEEGHEHEGHNHVLEKPTGHVSFSLTDERIQSIGVKFTKVKKENVFQEIEASGKVAFDPELYTAQIEYVEALKQQEQVKNSPIGEVKHSTQKMVESARLRLKVLGLSDLQIKKIAESKNSQTNLIVSERGEKVWIYAEVFEMDLGSVRSGLAVKITGGALGNETITGRVVSVDRIINATSRTAKVRIEVLNPSSVLRSGSFVNVTILVPLGEKITIPFDSVVDTGKQAWAFVKKENNYFEPRVVQIAENIGDRVVVQSGVNENDEIVTSANFLIDSESRLKSVIVEKSSKNSEMKSGE